MDEQSIFLEAMEKPSPEAQAAWLDEVCGEDEALKLRLKTMLRKHENAKSFLEQPAPGLEATLVTDRDHVPASLDAGLAPALGEDGAVVTAPNHSVLRSIENVLDEVPRVSLRVSKAERDDPIARPHSPEIPNVLGDSRYQLLGEIARGGMGAIIKGRDTDLGRDLAIKVLLDSHKHKPEVIQRFVEEAQIGGQLQHPGIAPVYEFGQFSDERLFFSMKLVKGETLSALLTARKDSAEDRGRFLAIFDQVCQTMAYAHSRGVIHRDLKPANMMVGAFGEVQVMDWGLAKVISAGGVADEQISQRKQTDQSVIQTLRSAGNASQGLASSGSQTQMGSVMGTPAYMPPEQARGEIDNMNERADVFGLGAILCEILTGKPPYTASSTTEVIQLALHGKLDDCFQRLDECDVDSELTQLVRDCLQVAQDNRPANAEVLANRFSGYLQSVEARLRDAELSRAAQEARVVEERKRRKVIMALAASTILFVGLGSAGWIYSERQSHELERKRIARKVAAEKVVQDDINTANSSLAFIQATSADHADLADREEALSGLLIELDKALISADQAAEAAHQEDVGEQLRIHAQVLKAEIQKVKTTYAAELKRVSSLRDFRDELNAIRLSQASLESETQILGTDLFDYGLANERYEAAFRKVGFDIFQRESSDSEEAVASSPLREEIIASLDQWAHAVSKLTPGSADSSDSKSHLLSRLETVYEAAESIDRNPWRRSLRFSLMHFARAEISGLEDDERLHRHLALLRDLATSDKARQQSTELLAWFGAMLRDVGEADTSVEMLRLVQQDHPQDFWVNYQLGASLLALDDHPQAIEYLRAALAVRPDSLQILADLITALLAAGRIDESMRARQELLMRLPTNEENRRALYRIGQRFIREGRYMPAVDAQRAYCRSFPNDVRGHFLLARFLCQTSGNYEEQLSAMQRVVDLQHADSADFAWLASSTVATRMINAGRYDDAIRAFEIAIQLDSLDDSARERLFNVYTLLGRWQDAADAATEWINNQPADAHRLAALAPTFVQSENQSAYVTHCNSMLKRFGNEADPAIASEICLASCLIPDLIDSELLPTVPLERLLDEPDAEPDLFAQAAISLALVALRNDQLDLAQELADKAEKKTASSGLTRALIPVVRALTNIYREDRSSGLIDFAKGTAALRSLRSNHAKFLFHQTQPHDLLLREAKASLKDVVRTSVDAHVDNLGELNDTEVFELYNAFEAWDAAGATAIKLAHKMPDGISYRSERNKLLQRFVVNDAIFKAMLDSTSDDLEVWLARGRILALRNQWDEAAEAFSHLPDSVTEPTILFELACIYRITGNNPRYKQLIKRFHDSLGDQLAIEQGMLFARAASFAPQVKAITQRAVDLAQLSVDEKRTAWNLHTLGLAQLRVGDFESAQRSFESSMGAPSWRSEQNHAALAILYSVQKRSSDAQKHLDRAKVIHQQLLDNSKDGAARMLSIDWFALNALIRAGEDAMSDNHN